MVESLHCNFHNIMKNSICSFHIVENITGCFPHCRNYQHLFHKLIYSTVTIHNVNHFENFSTYLNLTLEICGDFQKSFRNLPNFCREHACCTRAIFHLCFVLYSPCNPELPEIMYALNLGLTWTWLMCNDSQGPAWGKFWGENEDRWAGAYNFTSIQVASW